MKIILQQDQTIIAKGSVYFIVKTVLGTDTERKRQMAEKNYSQSFGLSAFWSGG